MTVAPWPGQTPDGRVSFNEVTMPRHRATSRG